MNYSDVIKKTKQSIALIVAFDKDTKIIGTGSGFVFSNKGIMVTCNHVVKDATTLALKFSNSTSFIPGESVLSDGEHDLSLLKFDDPTREPIPLGKLDNVQEGMQVVFSGYPLSSYDLTTHQGILSAIIKDASGIISYAIDGTVNPGNSGCPLMDMDGEVIGVINATRRMRADLLNKVENMQSGALSLHGIDIVEIYQALINNVQLGVGHAVPASYIPERKDGTVKKS